ncbi:MAG: hypothetical protein ACREUU_02705, partial [Gammaproteobacteria bacterium]
MLLPILCRAAPPDRGALLLWDFDQGVANAWGGTYNFFARDPSWTRVYLDSRVRRSARGYSLRVTAHRESQGFCGVWLEFFPDYAAPRNLLDATPFRYLSLWIKGQKGGEKFDLKLVDDADEAKAELIPTRPVQAYLAAGVTPRWQEVRIPLQDFRQINLGRLRHLVLDFKTPGDYRVYLDDLSLKSEPGAGLVKTAADPAKTLPDAWGKTPRALWVWETKSLFHQPAEADRFFRFCSGTKIDELYLAVELSQTRTDRGPEFQLQDADRYGEFLARAHRHGLRVEGLIGTPEWAARENHAHALAAAEAVLAFNSIVPPESKFDGVHYDVEPYLLLGYSDPSYRPQIQREFLEMVSRCAEKVRAQPGIGLSCDVPAWFYPAHPFNREELLVQFNGEVKTVGEHLTDLLDTVTLMDYRNQAAGSRGIIALGLPALAYAATKGRKIVVGVETFFEPDAPAWFLCSLPSLEFYRKLATSGLRNQISFAGFRIATFFDRDRVYVGLNAPAEMKGETRAAFESALVRWSRSLAAPLDPGPNVLRQARDAISHDAEWKGFDAIELYDPENGEKLTGFRSIRRMPPQTTFHGLGREVFEEEARSVIEWLSPFASFKGLAIHFYDSYRKLLEGGLPQEVRRTKDEQ